MISTDAPAPGDAFEALGFPQATQAQRRPGDPSGGQIDHFAALLVNPATNWSDLPSLTAVFGDDIRNGHIDLMLSGLASQGWPQAHVEALLDVALSENSGPAVSGLLRQMTARGAEKQEIILGTLFKPSKGSFIALDKGRSQLFDAMLADELLGVDPSFLGDALQFAAKAGYVDAVRQLIDRGAPKNVLQLDSDEPLDVVRLAAEQGHADVVEVLLQNGYDTDRPAVKAALAALRSA